VLLLACRRVVLGLAAGAVAALLAVSPAAADPAGDLIQSTAVEVIDIIKSTTPGAARQAAIQRILQTRFDLPYMGQTALGANWSKTSEAQRARFLKAAETAEARAYSERFGQYGGQTLVVVKVTSRSNGVSIVDSRLTRATASLSSSNGRCATPARACALPTSRSRVSAWS